MLHRRWLAPAPERTRSPSPERTRSRAPGQTRTTAPARAVATLLLFAGTSAAVDVAAQAVYPSRPVRYIVGYTPGGVADMVARAVGAKLADVWGQGVVIENRPGGGTNIATDLAAKAPPDGYTLFMPTVANVINATLFPKLNHDLMRDFVHVTNLASTPGIVVCHPSLPLKNAKDLIALARKRPNDLRHGSTGIGSPHHLAAELFKSMTGVKMVHVPYRGATPAITDVIAGHIEIYFGAYASTAPHVKTARLRGLAVTSLQRVGLTPDIPTLDEQGLKGFETGSWFGLSVPAGTPREVVAKLHTEVVRVIGLPEVRDRLTAEGAIFIGNSPEQFTTYLRGEIEKWGRAVKISGAKPE